MTKGEGTNVMRLKAHRGTNNTLCKIKVSDKLTVLIWSMATVSPLGRVILTFLIGLK